jgi:hypothetical protein
MLKKEDDLRLRAAVRTALFLLSISAGLAFIYVLAVLGALPGFIILLGVYGVFLIYDTNKTQIQYEDKLNEMVKNSNKKD